MKDEQWLPVVGYEGQYEVSSEGRVRGCERIITNKLGVARQWGSRILKPQPDGHGYNQINLPHTEKRNRTVKVYRLVAEAFMQSSQKAGLEVNHIDGDKQNDRADNLEWVTRLDNSKHAWKTGLVRARYGQDTSGAKLTPGEVQRIRERYTPYHPTNSAVALAREFCVSRQTISDIIKRKSWRRTA
jgi:hypothetical protein